MITYYPQNLFYQSNCEEAINIGQGQIRGTLVNIFVLKKCPFLYLPDAASVSRITPA